MTISTNWPDPNLPGKPLFPEYQGKHVLVDKRTGAEIIAIWGAGELLRPEWDVVGLSAVSEDVVRYFTYARCERVYVTPTQINEMLAAERKRCSNVCKTLIVLEEERYGVGLKTSGAEERIRALSEAQKLIRNLGDAP